MIEHILISFVINLTRRMSINESTIIAMCFDHVVLVTCSDIMLTSVSSMSSLFLRPPSMHLTDQLCHLRINLHTLQSVTCLFHFSFTQVYICQFMSRSPIQSFAVKLSHTSLFCIYIQCIKLVFLMCRFAQALSFDQVQSHTSLIFVRSSHRRWLLTSALHSASFAPSSLRVGLSPCGWHPSG